MPDSTHSFRMRLYLTSGSVAEFEQTEEDQVRSNIPLIAPDSIFTEPLLVVAGAHRATTFRTSEILRIEVDTTEKIIWTFSRQLESAEMLDEATFRAEHELHKDLPREGKRFAGAKFEALVEVQDVRGEFLHIRVTGIVPPTAARVHITEGMAEDTYLYARRNSTHVLVNTANLVSIALFPGPREVPYHAVKAHHVE